MKASVLTTVVFILLVSLIMSGGCKKRRDISALPYVASLGTLSPDAFGLVVTTSVEGYIEPCGCTSDPLGGIARFTTIFNDLKAVLKNNIALVDAGNLLFETSDRIEADRCQDEARIKVLLSTLSSLGLTRTLHGPLDHARGEDFLKQAIKSHGISSLSSLVDAPNPSLAQIEIGQKDKLIAVVGISSPANMVDSKIVAMQLDALKKKSRAKALIVLSQLQAKDTKKIFHQLAAVDIVIQGQSENIKPSAPTRLGDKGPWLLEGGRQGQFFSVVILENWQARKDEDLPLDTRISDRINRESLLSARVTALRAQAENANSERKQFLSTMIARAEKELADLKRLPPLPPQDRPHFVFHQIPITKRIDSDPVAKAKLENYEKNVPMLVKQCEKGMECPKPGPKESSFVGAQVCKACHQAAFEVWQNNVYSLVGTDDDGNEISRQVGHSKAWQTLVDDHKDADRSCIGCHSIGFMEKGGYCRASDVDFRKDVQCESCHGPGSLHAQAGEKQFIKRKVEEATCRGCHQVPHIETDDSFNYEEKLVRVLGKGHGENLLKQLLHKAKQ